MKRAIVLFATRYGSTQELAESLALKLGVPHKNVNAIHDAKELEPYDVLILGSPIYGDDVLPDMRMFIKSFFVKINERDIATFVVYGVMKGRFGVDYMGIFKKHFSKKPTINFSFVGRATRSSLSKQDHEFLERFYRERLKAPLKDFDYFDANNVEDAAKRIRAVLDSSKPC